MPLVQAIGELIRLGASPVQVTRSLIFLSLYSLQLFVQRADLRKVRLEFGDVNVGNVGEGYGWYVSRRWRLVTAGGGRGRVREKTGPYNGGLQQGRDGVLARFEDSSSPAPGGVE